MEKKFKMMADHLEVAVTHNDEIFLPAEEGKKIIGSFEQSTIQKINLDEVQTLVDFIVSENEKAETQLKAINQQLEPIKDIQSIDEKVVLACKKYIAKGAKEFKQKMQALNNHIESIDRCKKLTAQKEYVEAQLNTMKKELSELKEAIK